MRGKNICECFQTQADKGLGPAVLLALHKLPLGRGLLHYKQKGGCIYVNNAGTWNAVMHLGYHGTEGPT